MSGFYDTGIEGLLDQTLTWNKSEFRVALLRKGYGFKAGHKTLADVTAFAVGFSSPLTGCKVSGRLLLADDTHVLSTKDVSCDAVVVYRAGKTAAESRLFLHTFLPALKPLVGQRVEIPWPDGVIASF